MGSGTRPLRPWLERPLAAAAGGASRRGRAGRGSGGRVLGGSGAGEPGHGCVLSDAESKATVGNHIFLIL